jgi:cytochrome c nitrite reductase small subunit
MEGKRKKVLITVGLVIGLASFLFLTADTAISYTDNARFCLNCHVMNDAYESLQLSNHKQFKCTDCHAPHSYLPKVVFKTKSGLRDLYAVTLGEVPQIIRVTGESKAIISANCTACHKSTVEHTGMGRGRLCTDCHRDLVHKKM